MEKFKRVGSVFEYADDNFKIVFTSNEAGNMAYQATGDNVYENRLAVARELNRDLNDFVFAAQTHSDHIHEVLEADLGRGVLSYEDGITDVDSLYTFSSKPVLCVFYADCTPVYIYDASQNLMCVLHAGWQGTVKAITYKTLEHLKSIGINLATVKVVIGPSISYEHFEVEHDVIDKIDSLEMIDGSSTYKQVSETKYHADVKLVNKLQALASGVKEANVYVSSICTYDSEDLFSFRQNSETGRMISCIFKK